MLINVLKSTDFANTAYKTVKNRHFSANIVLCTENVSENEKSGKAEYSYFVPALWHLLLSPPRLLSCTSFYRRLISLFFAPHLVRIFRRSSIDAPRRGWGLSLCLPCRGPVLAPRRGRRPRRPAHVSTMSPAGGIFRAPGAGHFWPQRPDNLFLYASGGHISFSSERNMEKNAAKNQRFLDFPCPIPTTVQKGSTSNRLYPHPRCRSRVPRGSALLRRGRRPRRPVFRSLIAGCTRVLHFCLRRPYFFQQRKKYGKERRQKPVVFGFPLSDSNHGTKRFRIESLVPPSPLPLPRTARQCLTP